MPRETLAPLAPTAGSVRRGARPARILLPELSHLWIRYAPRLGRNARLWPGPDPPWLDLSRGGRLVWESGDGRGENEGLPAVPEGPLDDVLYLPPVAPAFRRELDRLARTHLERGTPVLVQRLMGDPPPPAGAVAVWDPTAVLLEGGGVEPGGVPLPIGGGAQVNHPPGEPGEAEGEAGGPVLLWPLLPGLSDEPAGLEQVLGRLSGGGSGSSRGWTVHPLVPPLDPRDRRRLAERSSRESEALFHKLFHGPRPDPREACRRVAGAGLAAWPERPLPRPPLPGAAARRAVGWLSLAAELHHRLGRPAAAHRGFLAARLADQARDLAALAREGHLAMLEGVGAEERELLARALEGRPPRLRALEEEYLALPPAGDAG